MLGDPRPIHTLPRDLFHVTNDHQRYMEMQVDVRRHHTAPEMLSELEQSLAGLGAGEEASAEE